MNDRPKPAGRLPGWPDVSAPCDPADYVDPGELAELRLRDPGPAPAECHCDRCEAMRRERLRALTPSQRRGVDPEDVSDDAFEQYLPDRRPTR